MDIISGWMRAEGLQRSTRVQHDPAVTGLIIYRVLGKQPRTLEPLIIKSVFCWHFMQNGEGKCFSVVVDSNG